jgi:hypothetical protein
MSTITRLEKEQDMLFKAVSHMNGSWFAELRRVWKTGVSDE